MIFPYRIIDLTHTLHSEVPTWNGSCGFHHDIQLDYSDCEGNDKFRVMKIKMHAGIGTHIDAPSHYVPGAQSVDDLNINQLCMPCIVIDVSAKSHENYHLMPQDILDFEKTHGMIPKGSCVLIKTGWEKRWQTPSKYHNNHLFPSVSLEAANILLERSVEALGIDTLSPDKPNDGFKVHKAFLEQGKILIENVANLDNMPPVDSFIMILPLKIKEGTEAPIRLIGLIEEKDNLKNQNKISE